MFGLQLSLPEHVQVNLDPNPEDGGKTFLLVIKGRAAAQGPPFELKKIIPRDVSALQFGKDLLGAINFIHGELAKRAQR